jgi:hypothetical protein
LNDKYILTEEGLDYLRDNLADKANESKKETIDVLAWIHNMMLRDGVCLYSLPCSYEKEKDLERRGLIVLESSGGFLSAPPDPGYERHKVFIDDKKIDILEYLRRSRNK